NLFKRISGAIPEKAWLQSIKDDGTLVVLKGYAADDEIVADFMRGLQRNKELGSIELEIAQRAVEKETAVELVSFTIRLEKERERPVQREKK
ncbi:MAG: PilN domain-containing protein, partial [Deltaproteobacteria bacterium]|nr:PilN domain-containing protein [Deltaproteobacteria bacterium]